jgi:hypothetical protein
MKDRRPHTNPDCPLFVSMACLSIGCTPFYGRGYNGSFGLFKTPVWLHFVGLDDLGTTQAAYIGKWIHRTQFA